MQFCIFPLPHSTSSTRTYSPENIQAAFCSTTSLFLQNAFSQTTHWNHLMPCCPESLNEYAAGNSASDPPQRTQTVIELKAFRKKAVLNAVTYVALRLVGEPVEPRWPYSVGTLRQAQRPKKVVRCDRPERLSNHGWRDCSAMIGEFVELRHSCHYIK